MGTRIQRPGQALSFTVSMLVLLLGCATRSVVVTTSGNAPSPAATTKPASTVRAGESTPKAEQKTGPMPEGPRSAPGQAEPAESAGSPSTGGPLAGFSKTPAEERVMPPLMAKLEPPESHARQAPQTPEHSAKQLADIYFSFDRWSLTPQAQRYLTESADVLKQNPTASIVIEGYCDERGSHEYNLVLGEKRAEETSRFLQALGVTNPVHVTSYGKERQVCPELGEACYWKNRRAHLVVEETKP